MSPEALARLREVVTGAFDGSSAAEQMLSNGPVAELLTDLRALLDAYAEALERLSPFAHRECDDSIAGYVCGCEQCLAFRFLAKAGRR